MSRCFAYPPPGYALPDNRWPLIDSIKLQKDKEKAKEERRKERKQEKKDKKRKHEVQSTPNVDGFGEKSQKLINEKSQKLERQTTNLKGKYAKCQGDDVNSDVTNEQDQPVCVAKPSCSSEDSQNSDKKRRKESSANTFQRNGSFLKIRLSSFGKKEDSVDDARDWPSLKNKEPSVIRDQPSTSGRTDPIGQKEFGYAQRLVEGHFGCTSTSAEICPPGVSPLDKLPSFLGTQRPNKDVAITKSSTSKTSKVELLYKSLLEKSLVPPALRGQQGFDENDDWLFQRKFQNTERSEMTVRNFQDSGRSETISNSPCSMDSNLWPRAQFLPSTNVYALPYVVPF